jgi:hypothetical protein
MTGRDVRGELVGDAEVVVVRVDEYDELVRARRLST